MELTTKSGIDTASVGMGTKTKASRDERPPGIRSDGTVPESRFRLPRWRRQ